MEHSPVVKTNAELIKELFIRTPEQLREMEETEFCARMRERTHHTMEIQVYEALYGKRKINRNQADTVKMYLREWERRGLSLQRCEYKNATLLLKWYEALVNGEKVDLSHYEPQWPTAAERETFKRIVGQRRSVRQWDWTRRVPDELLDEVLEAGLWAAHACNLQSIRYVVVREESCPGLFKNSDIPGGPVHILICQDMRCYKANQFMPEYNILLDCGAAGQNVVLAAHAAGLGGCWLTFTGHKFRQRVIDYFKLPDYITPVTYVDVGYPDQAPAPPLRQTLDEAVIARA